MVEKNRKLKEQFAAAARAGSTGETKTAIFTGLSFWMTGRTCLPDQELKRLIVEHGGVYEQYGFTHVTHVIADNLAAGNQQWAQLKKRTKRVNVVTSSWIMDCVKEGRRLPEIRYMPACLSSASSMLSFMDRQAKEEAATPDRCSDEIITDESPQVEQAAPSKPAPHPPSHDAAVAAQAARTEGVSPPRKKAKHCLGGIPAASSSFALQVSTHCPEGLDSLAELMEVLSDLSDSSARQLRQQSRCSTAAGLRISVGDSAMEWSGAGNLANASHHSSDILPVLKSLAARAVTALSLEHAGYKSVSDVEVRLQCDQGGLEPSPSLDSPSPPLAAPASNQREESPAVQLQWADHDQSPEVPSIGSQSDCGPHQHDIQMGSCTSKEPHPEAKVHCQVETATRPHWKDLPVWAADVNANTRELMQHWRGICKTLQSMKPTGLRAWHSMCHGPESEPGGHQPSVTASLDCHEDAFKTLLASREYEVVHLALRALRISTSKRVPSTLRGEGNRQDGIVLDYALCIVSPIKLTQAEV